MIRSSLLVLAVVAALLSASTAGHGAEVRLPAVIGDNMVLQAGGTAPVWGWVGAGEEVTVSFAGEKLSVKAGADGRFLAALPCPKAGVSGDLSIEGASGARRVLKNVATGEVWVCSGQSNMEWPVRLASDGQAAIEAAAFPDLRLFTVEKAVADEPQADCKGAWVACSPETVAGFSAVGFFFGRELLRELKTPVGLVNTSWGGTPAESWTSRKALAAADSLEPLLERWDKTLAEKPGEKKSPHRPANLYNAMIAPLLPFAIRGAIWYQGESNAGRADEYRTLFPAMIRDWRRAWANEALPFHFVQLANFMEEKPEPGESAWAELRDAQLFTLRSVPHTGMAVIIDIGEAKDIHPRNKLDVGKRLALWALKRQYGKDVVESGPVFREQRKDGDRILLSFDHAGGGLACGQRAEAGPSELKGFAVAGADRKFFWARARIQGETVVVSSPQVPDPVAVRYAWADNPSCNLYNLAGLPATPFRTDDWPLTTAGKH
jgi:sialate O-acetylesterase